MKDGKPMEKKRGRLSLRNIFYHNTFVLVFSFAIALVTWFVMAYNSDMNRTFTIQDVPIVVVPSTEAEADGLRVFNMSYAAADIDVSGNSLITSKLTAEDFKVTVSLNPTSTKLTGNTLQKMTVPVQAVKNSALSEYDIVSINPEEINLEYDRYKEVTLPLEDEIVYSADAGFYPGSPVLSQDSVTISGPESAVNRVSRAAVGYTLDAPLRDSQEFSCPIRLYDQNNQEITDTASLYLTLSVDTVQATIPVMARKTVPLVVNTVHQPDSFAQNRISIEPAEIAIAGSQEVLDGISEICLGSAIDFADLDLSRPAAFDMEIPLPSGVRNITNAGENTVTQAKVSINLNGYSRATLTVPEANIQLLNPPAGKDARLTTRSMEVSVIGPQAQVGKLTGDSIFVQIDLANVANRTGSIEAPAAVTISGTAGEACWVSGSYTATVTLSDAVTIQAGAGVETASAGSSDGVVAKPQE